VDGIPAIVDFATPGTPDVAPVAADRVLDGAPVAHVDNRYSDPSQHFHCGTWGSTPGRWRIRYTEHEFCSLTRGRIRLVADDGAAREFTAPAAFVIPAGFEGTWETLEACEKHYVIYEPG
jgi:uncharacterized cupin superfamily protein